MNPYLNKPKPAVIAHRGGGGRYPENTFGAFERVAALDGVHALELDVHLTKDGEVIVVHDPTLDRTADGSGEVRSLTLSELQKMDAGYHWSADGGQTYPFRGQGWYWPTLGEVFENFGRKQIINIDLKQRTPSMVEPFVALLEQHNMQANVLVGSFHHDTITAFRQLSPTVATVASLPEVRRFYLLHKIGLSRFYRGSAQVFQIPEWSGKRRLITPRFVRDLHQHDILLHVWTVNDSAEMRRLLEWGVDGLITDYPDRLIALLEGTTFL